MNPLDTTIFLFRHGETDWNVQDRMQGQTDVPLNQNGIDQANKLRDLILQKHSDIMCVYSSDLKRASVTAEIIAKPLKEVQVFMDHRLREIGFGKAEGLTIEKIEEQFGHLKKELDDHYPQREIRWNFTEIPEGETYSNAAERIKTALFDIAKKFLGKKIAVVTHGTLMSIFVSEIYNRKELIDFHNCSVVALSYTTRDDEKPFNIIGYEL